MNKNILFLLHIPPPVHGSSMVGQWIKESQKINSDFDCRYLNLLASENVGESGKVTFRKLFGFVKLWFLLLGELIAHKTDLCYLALTSTGAAFCRDVLLVFLLKMFGVKRVYHQHNKGVAKASASKVNRFFYRFVFKKAVVILLSEYLYDDIKDFVPQENVHICPNGIPSQLKVKGEKLKVRNDTPRILFLSNLIESKGVFVLLEAMALLQEKGMAFQGIFVGGEGDISAQQFQQKVADLKLSDKVQYLGKRYGEEKEDIFHTADIFAFPTLYPNECFPLVLLEAMQHQLPVISTTEGGIRSIIDDSVTGYLLQMNSSKSATPSNALSQQLAKHLEYLIEHPEIRQQLGKAGREKYKKQYTLSQFEKRMFEILLKT